MKIPTGGFIYPDSSTELTDLISTELIKRSDEDEARLLSLAEVMKASESKLTNCLTL